MSRLTRCTIAALVSMLLVSACSSNAGDDGGAAGTPGAGAGGAPIVELGGRSGSGGASVGGTGGAGARPTGGAGGTPAQGGAPTGGTLAEGGSETGGLSATGGSTAGGTGGNASVGIVPIGGICANTGNCDPSAGAVTCCEGTCLLSEDCTQTGYLPCDSAASCSAYGGGKVCCEVNITGTPTRFCTKPSACNGTELP